MQLLLSEIKRIIKAHVSGQFIPDKTVSVLLNDSRKLIHPSETMFFAIRTSLRDGHGFIENLYTGGVRIFVVEEDFVPDLHSMDKACFLHVSSPIGALQDIAANYRKNFKIPVIGITGSNGKTIVKEWLYHLLSEFGKTLRSPKSYNSQIGVPLSVVLLEPFYEYAIFEAGISKPGEMEVLKNIINPEYGIFTTIGPSHDENFKISEEKITEKLNLFQNSEKIVLSDQHTLVIEIGLKTGQLTRNKMFLWGFDHESDIVVTDIQKFGSRTRVSIRKGKQISEFQIPFIDDASVENAMHCFSAMIMMGFHPDRIAPLMKSLPVIAMRLEMHNGLNNCLLINDSYNSDLQSLTIALDFVKQQQQNRKATIILSDILQTGIFSETLYKQTAKLLKNRNISKLIAIGPEISAHKKFFEQIETSQFFRDTDQFLSEIKLSGFQNEMILVKGARCFEFERIVGILEQKSHQTVLEVNLNAIQNNLNEYRSLLRPQTAIMAMVKAFSYGTGSHEIAGFLEYHQVNYLGVAYADEGVELRKKGIKMPVMVMAPEEASLEPIIRNDLEPEIYNFESLAWICKYPDDVIKIHLKFDTGMHRLGFDKQDIPALCEQLKDMKNVRVMSVFSHLAVSDDEQQQEFTRKQIAKFELMCDQFSMLSGVNPMRHILNSAGIENYNEFQYEMVRLGLGLYGIQPSKNNRLKLQQAVRLKTHIIQIKHIRKGERIGYGTTCVTDEDIQVAVIPIGYADGFRRSLSNGKGIVMLNGHRCNVVGNVCMDMTIINITSLDAHVGDEIVIFDETHTVEELASLMDVIPYEVLTGVSGRVKRRYLME